jgi:hypothetical protein
MPLKHLQHMQHAQHPRFIFANIHMKQLQYTSETSETLLNMRFHRNISLLRLRIAVPMASTATTTFWWGTVASAAPRHPRETGHGAQQRGHGAQRARPGVAGDGAWHGYGGVRRGMEDGAGCGSRAVGKTTAASARRSSTRWAKAIGRYLERLFFEKILERDRKTQRVSRPVRPLCS